jgi:hypothetical protein
MVETGEWTTGATPGPRRAAAGLVVLAWCAVVAVTATAGWLVVDRAGVSLLGSSGPGLSGVAAGPTTSTATATTPAQGAALNTAGGQVAATCGPTGAVSLQSAIPAQGWKVEYTPGGPKTLTVEFTRSGRATVEVHATCVAGRPVVTQDTRGSGAGGSPSTPRPAATTTDDHGGGTKGGGSGSSGSGGGSGGSGKGGGSDDSGGSSKGGGSSDDR